MNSIQHKNLAEGKWKKLSFSEQMGNIGSEVGRALSWQKRNSPEHKEKALERAFELFDLTITDGRWGGLRLREIVRAREVLADFFYGENFYKSTAENLERYFYYFAYSARKAL